MNIHSKGLIARGYSWLDISVCTFCLEDHKLDTHVDCLEKRFTLLSGSISYAEQFLTFNLVLTGYKLFLQKFRFSRLSQIDLTM